MKCKFCGKELEDELDVCQDCANSYADETEETAAVEEIVLTAEPEIVEEPAPEVKTEKVPKAEKTVTITVSLWKIVAATVICVVLLLVLVGAVIYGITGKLPYNLGAKETTAATDGAGTSGSTETTAAPMTAEDLGMTIEGITDVAMYTAEDDAALAAADEVVAQVGSYTLTNAQLQVFYRMEFNNFVVDATENGYDVATSYGLDIYSPLSEQYVLGSEVSWEQYFLHNALGTWWQYASANIVADEAGYELPEESKTSIASVRTQLEADAQEDGYEGVDALLKDRLGAACDMEDYEYYMELTARGDLYYTAYQETYEPTEEDVKAFFELNADYYSQYGITTETGKLAAVRHVLLVPEGAEVDDSGYVTATDEQWTAGRIAAVAMLDAWVAEGATEEAFAEMANEHSTDEGSNANGGLYEGVYAGQMVENFNNWVFDETRQPGDYGVVQTEFGHHLMYFVSLSENDAWYEYAYSGAKSTGYGFNQLLNTAMDANALEKTVEKIVLSDVSQEQVETEEETDATTPTEVTEAAESTENTGSPTNATE